MTQPFEPNGARKGRLAAQQGQPLGMVIEGSVANGVEIRLDPDVSVEQIKVGTFVTLQGSNNRFFGVVTDVGLGSTDPRMKYTPLPADDPFVIQVLQGTVAFGTVSVLPQLTMPDVMGDDQGPAAAKSIPAHFSRAFTASQEDVETVFGSEEDGNFWIGSPLDMETKLCLDLGELVKRSMGVFGKSGTGKTFLTRLLLAGILQNGEASSLIFDMHSEYGWQGQDTDKGVTVKGLKQLFGAKVSTFTLDEEHSRRRGLSTDETVHLGFNHVEPEDVELLRESLNLSEVAASAAYNLREVWRGQLAQGFLGYRQERVATGVGRGATGQRRRSQGAIQPDAAIHSSRFHGGAQPGRHRRPDDRAPGARAACCLGVWPLRRRRSGIYPGQQPHYPPHPPQVRRG